jgi:hypothetical protein
MAYNAGATAAAVAAAEARRRMMEEEEQMTGYSDDELQTDWEFKIVRANSNVFGKPEEFQKLVGEEKQAGWVLLEKLDNSRVRFKRRRSAQSNDAQLISSGLDPYRTHYGMSPGAFGALVVIITMAVMLGVIILIIASTN